MISLVDMSILVIRFECINLDLYLDTINSCNTQGGELSVADPGGGGGVLGVRTSPFWGTPKLHKRGKNVACVLVKRPRLST